MGAQAEDEMENIIPEEEAEVVAEEEAEEPVAEKPKKKKRAKRTKKVKKASKKSKKNKSFQNQKNCEEEKSRQEKKIDLLKFYFCVSLSPQYHLTKIHQKKLSLTLTDGNDCTYTN